MDIDSLFVTHAEAAKLIEPGEGSFYYPSPSAQSTASRAKASSAEFAIPAG